MEDRQGLAAASEEGHTKRVPADNDVVHVIQIVSLDGMSSSTMAGTNKGTLYLWATGTGRLQVGHRWTLTIHTTYFHGPSHLEKRC